uniref:Uncharacterized protein n=1 Tax=Brassica campestris TaxID=3711 RepID=M4DGJ2_BRACM
MHGLVSYQRFRRAWSLRSDQALARARSLRSDRAWLSSVASGMNARSLRSDRALARDRELLSFIFFTPPLRHTFINLSSSNTFAFNMSSSQGDKRDSDVEMDEATSPASVLTSPAEVPACVAGHLSFREKLVRCQAEKELVQAGSKFSSSSERVVAPAHGTKVVAPLPQALPVRSSTTPILVEDKERAADSMPPPPARKEIILALRAPSAVPVAQRKSRKRKLAKSGDGESSQQGGCSLASGLCGKIEVDAGLASRGIQEATDALRAEFQAHLAKISASLGSLECIRSRDLALATIEGGIAVVRSFQSEAPPTLEAEEARLSGCKGDMAAVDGDFDLILADLKSACVLPTCSEDPEGKDPMVGENGGDAAPGSDEATGEEGA